MVQPERGSRITRHGLAGSAGGDAGNSISNPAEKPGYSPRPRPTISFMISLVPP
jgi:hypothetical protein